MADFAADAASTATLPRDRGPDGACAPGAQSGMHGAASALGCCVSGMDSKRIDYQGVVLCNNSVVCPPVVVGKCVVLRLLDNVSFR